MHHHHSGMLFLSVAVLNWCRHTWILHPEDRGGGTGSFLCPADQDYILKGKIHLKYDFYVFISAGRDKKDFSKLETFWTVGQAKEAI